MEQLRTLHIAGREGLHAPTLAEFIDAFQECKCRRPLIIEVKQLHTDQGRQRLLQLLRSVTGAHALSAAMDLCSCGTQRHSMDGCFAASTRTEYT